MVLEKNFVILDPKMKVKQQINCRNNQPCCRTEFEIERLAKALIQSSTCIEHVIV